MVRSSPAARRHVARLAGCCCWTRVVFARCPRGAARAEKVGRPGSCMLVRTAILTWLRPSLGRCLYCALIYRDMSTIYRDVRHDGLRHDLLGPEDDPLEVQRRLPGATPRGHEDAWDLGRPPRRSRPARRRLIGATPGPRRARPWSRAPRPGQPPSTRPRDVAPGWLPRGAWLGCRRRLPCARPVGGGRWRPYGDRAPARRSRHAVSRRPPPRTR